jgi:uncharacterized protein
MPPFAELASYLGIGAIVGFFAGLLGIGGGLITVSSLAIMFAGHGYPAEYVMHMAVGTSLAVIVAGSWSSFRAHHRHGAVDWDVVRAMTPGMLLGVVGGSVMARFLSTAVLKYFFLAVMAAITAQMAFSVRPTPSRGLPGKRALAGVGAGIGLLSSLMGGGAAAIGVPFLTWCSMTTHRAIGTVAAMGFPLALAGTLGYVVSGWSAASLPTGSVGFVYLPAFAAIAIPSMLLAPVGAKLAHRLKGTTLRRIFALFLIATGAKVAISV